MFLDYGLVFSIGNFSSQKNITLEEKKLDYEFLKICRKLFLFVSSHKTGTEAAAQKCSLGGMGVLLVFSLCSPVNLLHIFRTPFPKNTSGGLLLQVNIFFLE